jgi:beta-glucosidase
VQELKAFAKVTLDPGQSEDVVLELGPRSFAVWDVAARDWLVEPGDLELLVGTSSRDIRHRLTVAKLRR